MRQVKFTEILNFSAKIKQSLSVMKVICDEEYWEMQVKY